MLKDDGESQPQAAAGASGNVFSLAPANRKAAPELVSFNRRELVEILNVYGAKVAAGEWRDYAIGASRERAVFAVFRRAAELPVYSIEKDPKLARRQGAYSVVNATGHVLKRGRELANVLKLFEERPRLAFV